MRRARVEDAWRRLTTKDRRFGIERVSVAGKPPLASFDAELASGLTIVSGLNAVGKTTFLRLIFAAVAGTRESEELLRPELIEEGQFTVLVRLDDEVMEFAVGAAEGDRPNVLHIDAYDLCYRLLSIGSQPNFADLLEGREPYQYTEDERGLVSSVVGKRYEGIRVIEFEEPQVRTETTDEVTLPYFTVSSDGADYDNARMGLGELAALVLLWKLGRVESTTIILLEEPETFLSSHSTLALLDVIAARVTEKRLYAVATTHSPDVIARIPTDAVRLLRSSSEGMVLTAPSRTADVEQVLRAVVAQGQAVLVEDLAAAVFLREMLTRHGGLWGASLEIAIAGSAGTVVALCRQMPTLETCRVVGVLDGDQEPPVDTRVPALTLPGGRPEDDLRQAAARDPQAFASVLNRQRELVESALGITEGTESHDWFGDIGKLVGLDAASVLRAAARCWMDTAPNDAGAVALVSALEKVFAPGSN